MQRRTALKLTVAASAGLNFGLLPTEEPGSLEVREIYSSGEKIPVVGLGTWRTFDASPEDPRWPELKEVLKSMVAMGGSVVDSSPMYGRSEGAIGTLSRELGISSQLFMATKVWTRGKSAGVTQMDRSAQLMAKQPMDLMQVHNLLDWKEHLPELYRQRELGMIRYIGITHYLQSAYSQMEDIVREYPLDFIQINYSIQSRKSADRLLPLAHEKGVAVIINRPFEGGDLFRVVKNRALPPWAGELNCNSWAQYFLKFILSNPAVTCVIPGTSQSRHLRENLQVGMDKLPDSGERQKMVAFFDRL